MIGSARDNQIVHSGGGLPPRCAADSSRFAHNWNRGRKSATRLIRRWANPEAEAPLGRQVSALGSPSRRRRGVDLARLATRRSGWERSRPWTLRLTQLNGPENALKCGGSFRGATKRG